MVKEAGYELNVWTVNKPARANQTPIGELMGIFTDNADKMVHLLIKLEVKSTFQ